MRDRPAGVSLSIAAMSALILAVGDQLAIDIDAAGGPLDAMRGHRSARSLRAEAESLRRAKGAYGRGSPGCASRRQAAQIRLAFDVAR
jgi:hypothetical protein